MSKNTTVVGLMETLQNKAKYGAPVTMDDVIGLAQIMNHNAFKLTESANKIEALENQFNTLVTMVNDGFTSTEKSLQIHDECLTGLADVTDGLTDSAILVDADLDGIYADLNEIAEPDEDHGPWERDSVIAERQNDEACQGCNTAS